jgi:uncharacterized membrane protein
MNTRRVAHRALAAAASLLVLGAATTADAGSPAHASSVSATTAYWPSQGGVAAESSASTRAPFARSELHFRNLYPESSVFLVIAIRDHDCDHYQGFVSIGWWKLDYNVDRLVWAGEVTDENDAILYYAQSADGKARWTSDYNKIWVSDNAPFRICQGAPGSETWRRVGTLQVLLDPHEKSHRVNLVP